MLPLAHSPNDKLKSPASLPAPHLRPGGVDYLQSGPPPAQAIRERAVSVVL